jgi:DNA-binding response OmpR family regulator
MGAQILLVEPDRELATDLELALSSAGYAVTVVDTLDEAQGLGWPPALVIPSLWHFEHGPALCAAVLRLWPQARLIVLTRDPDPLARPALRYAGADACLTAPVDPDRLVAEVRRLVP